MKRIVSAVLIAVLAVACSQKSPSSKEAAAPAAQQTATFDLSKLPPGHPAMATPANAPTAAPQGMGLINGTIVETMNAAGYTYLKLRTPSGDVWAAVRETKVKVGDNITIAGQMTMENFESETLKRKFDRIVFATMPNEAEAAPSAGAQPAMGSAMGGAAQHMQVRDLGDVNVPKAEGGKTIAELWSEKATLKEKPVVVRGKVVKFLAGIMGKNWIHLRDGSGSKEAGTNDVTVTTKDVVNVGDVVVVTGKLEVDKDLGAGYHYGVIIENATVRK